MPKRQASLDREARIAGMQQEETRASRKRLQVVAGCLAILLVLGAAYTVSNARRTQPEAATLAIDMPSVTGAYGAKPTIVVDPKTKPPTKTTSKVLLQGKGPRVAMGELLVADYLGQILSTSRVFDNSYDRGQPDGFVIRSDQIFTGWDKALVGVPAGSRVLIVVPSVDRYREDYQKVVTDRRDTLVFVVDVIASYGRGGVAADARPATALPANLPTVGGKLGERPTVKVEKGLTPPKAAKMTVLAKGTGPAVVANRLVVVQYEGVSWDHKLVGSTWKTGVPVGYPVGVKGTPGRLDQLVGVPLGSRVLFELLPLPPEDGAPAKKPAPPTDSLALVVDVISQHGSAKG